MWLVRDQWRGLIVPWVRHLPSPTSKVSSKTYKNLKKGQYSQNKASHFSSHSGWKCSLTKGITELKNVGNRHSIRSREGYENCLMLSNVTCNTGWLVLFLGRAFRGRGQWCHGGGAGPRCKPRSRAKVLKWHTGKTAKKRKKDSLEKKQQHGGGTEREKLSGVNWEITVETFNHSRDGTTL